MAELDFDQFDQGGAGRPVRLTGMMNVAGAACSIALVAGLGLWGYQLAVRDVNGVPVIRALAGPMREMPQSPGGDVASHQGLSVNAVAAVGIAAAMPDQVLLAPAPVGLAVEDAAGMGAGEAALQPAVEVGTSTISPISLSASLDASVDAVLEATPDPAGASQDNGTDAAIAMALAEALAVGAEPFTELASLDTTSPAVLPSVRPKPRPSQTSAVAVDAGDKAPPTATASEIDPATLSTGTRLVQLGAFDIDTEARAEWARLQTRFGDRLTGKAMVIQAAQSGGRTFYRLRAHGFAGEDDARQFCAALVAENTPCIPALHR